MNSVKSARQRMLRYPAALSKCSTQLKLGIYFISFQAAAYGKCISTSENLKKSDCQKEFEALRECVKNAM
ncbi:hypothetical protein EGW08_012463 [Elysia chlorotica]|uniref:IMS import disulfide relay-system CHCH-CHCH-like Cx9C domain-containing protein n=1 Tax=Elysia chlorotica TaxID=188477 RepID=A0A433TDW1_ELYCH|nr:hypothetical protein EGW08_012463 [Elysia chlorotica]